MSTKGTVDVFGLLAGTGAKFDRSRFNADMMLFKHSGSVNGSGFGETSKKRDASKASGGSEDSLLPELDFFQSAAIPEKEPKSRNRASAALKKEGSFAEEADALHLEERNHKRAKRNDPDDDDDDEAALETLEEADAFRKLHKIKVLGTDVPYPFATYKGLCDRYQFPQYLRKNLTTKSYTTPTPIQMQSIPIILHEREVIACAPTGSGKTLAFLVPILYSLGSPKGDGIRAVIISPTRELALQIHRHVKDLTKGRNFKTCVLTKSTNANNPLSAAQLDKFDILITTPMRLVNAIDHDGIRLNKVRHLVLDEADKLLEIGFLGQMDSVFAACTSPHLQRSLFSATMPSGIEALAKTFMIDPIRVIVGTINSATSSIKQTLKFVGDENGKLIEIRQMAQSGGLKPPALIFVQSIERAKELFNELVYDGINVDVIHSEKSKAQRDAAIQSFRIGKTWILISTDLMSRGIDFKGVSMVINYDFPQSVQSYIHRIGRTGRAGREGSAVTFFTKEDSEYLKIVVNVMKDSGCDVPEWMLNLKNPNKKERKKLRKQALERGTISTMTKYDKKKIAHKRNIVASQKVKKEVEVATK
ncbi:RNA-dependent ATPase rok1 [Entophlyctis sp. JEL0112]|nr:RNA-dependent ATPase rok1 [Entophlyctis sp. JEL0112]